MKILTITLYLLLAPGKADTAYQQHVRFLEPGLFKPHAKGIIYVTSDSIRFVTLNDKKSHMNFALPLEAISRIKNEWQYIFPNRLSLVTESRKFLLYTYQRKRLRRAIWNKVHNAN